MPKKQFSRGQTQILYRHLPGAIFEHDDYGLCKVETILLEESDRINKSALFDTLIDALQKWEREEFREKFPDPRVERNRRRYRIGQPKEVQFNPFPLVLQCRKCKHVVEYGKINKKGMPPGQCPRPGCGGRMLQMPLVEAHNCGRIQEVFVPPGCPEHKRLYLKFNDTGRAATSHWVCGICHREIKKARMTPCKCEYSETVPGNKLSDKFMRLYPTTEPGLYSPHVVAFINFSEEHERNLSQLEDGHPILLARVWGILEQKVLDIATERKRWKPGSDEIPPHLKNIIEALERVNPNDPALKQYKKYQENPPAQNEINRVRSMLGGVDLPVAPPRKVVEHVALQDGMNLTGVDTAVRRLRERGSNEQANRFERESAKVMDSLGIADAHIVNDFPIALSALGFTRVTRDPQRSVFNPFPPSAEDSRIPLYVIPTETEGMWFRLDPVKVSVWLQENGIVAGDPPKDRLHAWAWIYREVLQSGFGRMEEMSAGTIAVESLVHTMSHVMLKKIEWSGFAPSSVGEYLMPETLSFILYANRFADAKIGGLTTLFEQRLPLWLHDAAQSGRECVYDPLCSEDGGSCAGCLYREHNCPFFNRQLSRAVLYGGVLPQDDKGRPAGIRRGYWHDYVNVVSRG